MNDFDDFDYVPKMIKEMENHPLHANRQKEKPMNNIDKAKQAVEAAQKQLDDAIKALEQAEKKANKIGLKLPEMGEFYYMRNGEPQTTRSCESNIYYARKWASTNKEQSKAFYEALRVMAEMRVQDGIVVPNGSDDFYSISTDIDQKLSIDMWSKCIGLSLFPAFESERAAQKAIDNVGEERVINCIKTMMFMTPESRGEKE